MSSIELTEWLARQLREALSIIEEQARLLELHGITECEGDGCTPSLSERRKDALQGRMRPDLTVCENGGIGL